MKHIRIVWVLVLVACLLSAQGSLASPTGNDVTALLTDLSVAITQGGVIINDTDTLSPSDPVHMLFSFGIPVKGDEPRPTAYVQHGDYAEFRLTTGFTMPATTQFELKMGSVTIGHITLEERDESGHRSIYAHVAFDGDEVAFDGTYYDLAAYFQGDFSFDGTGSGDVGGDKFVAILNKSYTVVIPPGEVIESLSKSGVLDFENRVINWSATVNRLQDGSPVTLEGYEIVDTLTAAGPYVPGSFKVDNVSATPDITATGIKYTFPAGAEGPVTVTYQTSLRDDQYYSAVDVTARNSLQLLNTTDTEVRKASAVVRFNPGWISKTGSVKGEGGAVYNPVSRTITWFLEANERGLPLDDVYIIDALPAGLTWDSAYWQSPNGADWETQHTFASQPVGDRYEIGDINTKVRLVIVANVPDENYVTSVTTYTNSGTVGFSGTGVPGAGIGTGGVGVGVGFNPISKSGVPGAQAGRVDWEVVVDVRSQQVNDLRTYDLLVYGSTFSAGGATGGPSGLDLGTLTPQYNQRYVSGTFAGGTGHALTVYTLKVGGNEVADLLEVTGLTQTRNEYSIQTEITNPDLFAGHINARVYNTASLYTATTKLNDATAAATYNSKIIDKSMLDRTSAQNPLSGTNADNATGSMNLGFDYASKTVVFRIIINPHDMDFTNKTNEDGILPGTVTITDTLPAGWEFVDIMPGQGKYYLLAGTASPSGGVLAGNNPSPVTGLSGFGSTVIGGTATFTFTDLSDPYVILVRAKPTDAQAEELFDQNETTQADNTVTLTTEHWTGFSASDSQSVTVTSQVLGKTATFPEQGVATWQLEYRPLAATTDPVVSITDKIPQGVELRIDVFGNLLYTNIKAYELSLAPDGNFLFDPVNIIPVDGSLVSYNTSTRMLAFTIPDASKAYRFTYITDITGNPGQRITNDATLVGRSSTPTKDDFSFVVSSADAGATLSRGGNLQIDKRGGLGRALAGVEYTLYAVDGNTVIRKGTSDAAGIITMRAIPALPVYYIAAYYYLSETSAPTGYALSMTEYTVTVVDKGPLGVETTIASPGVGNTLQVRNITTEKQPITARKVWVGGFIANRYAPVLDLYADGVKIDNSIIPYTAVVDPVNPDSFIYTWPDMPVYRDGTTEKILYTVQEPTTPEGYYKVTTNPTTAESPTERKVTNTYFVEATKRWVNGRWAAKDPTWLQLYRHLETDDISTRQAVGNPIPVDPVYSPGSTEYSITVTWNELEAEDSSGTDYVYTVEEGTVVGTPPVFTPGPPTNFGSFIDNGTRTVTNTYVIPKRNFTATKTWVGYESQRPTIYFRLRRRTIAGSNTTWGTSPGNWSVLPFSTANALPSGITSVVFTDLDATNSQGIPYEYDVIEVDQYGFNWTPPNYVKDETAVNEVVNAYRVSASKVWQGGEWAAKNEVWLKLFRHLEDQTLADKVAVNGAAVEKIEPAPYPSTTNPITVSWDGLDAEDPVTGKKYIYTVEEGNWDGTNFTPWTQGDFIPTRNGLSVTNTYVSPKREVTATKQWVGSPAATPTFWFRLQRRTIADLNQWGKAGTWEWLPMATVQEMPSGAVAVTWTGLDEFDEHGVPYEYQVLEVDQNGNPWTPPHYSKVESVLEVTNYYKAAGTLVLRGAKQVVGRDVLPTDRFFFMLYEGSIANANLRDTQIVDGNGTFEFKPINYTLDFLPNPDVDHRGNHTYVVVEYRPATNPSGGITYDTTVYTFTVAVSDAGDGTLNITSSNLAITEDTSVNGKFYGTGLAFGNRYRASGSLVLSGAKLFSGRDAISTDKFTFELYEGATATGTPLDTKEVQGVNSGTFTFAPIQYALDRNMSPEINDLGNHTYTVVERVPATNPSNGITYDTRQYTFTVTVTDAGDGTLNVVSATTGRTITGANGVFRSEGLNFGNDYAASGRLAIRGSKLLSGRTGTFSDTFGFTLTAVTPDTPLPTPATSSLTFTANGEQEFTFPTISYTMLDLKGAQSRDFVYALRETVPVPNPKDGITYDGTTHLITVTVTDNRDGTLAVTVPTGSPWAVAYDATLGSYLLTKPSYANQYAATGSLELRGDKLFSGRDATVDDEFTFELYIGTEAMGTPLQTKTVKGVNSGTFVFAPIKYAMNLNATPQIDDRGTHAYTVVERVPLTNPKDGITYDIRKHTFSVTVTDAGNGTLTVTSTDLTITGSNGVFLSNGLDFDNDYRASGSLVLSGAKLFRGRDATSADKFTFELYKGATATGTPLYIQDVQGVNSGTFTFTPIQYALDRNMSPEINDLGDHTYTVVERVPATNPSGGITHDTRQYTFTVTVTDAGDGTLNVASATTGRTITGANGIFRSEGFDFVNDYAASGTLELSGAKLFRGRNATAADEFIFKLYKGTAATGTPLQTKTVSGVNSGTFAFDPIDYHLDLYAATPLDDRGDHTYTVVEQLPATNPSGGITYDTRKYTFTMTVTDAGDGTLNVTSSDRTITGSNGIFQSTGLDYVNDYAASGTLELSGAKLFRGRNATAADEFTFELYAGTEATGTPIDTKTVKGVNSGTFTFDTITYALDLQAATPLNDLGDHTYTVVERVPATNPSSGITYDTAKYTFTVTVTDAGDGTLTVASLDRTITGSNGVFQSAGLDYVNDYAASGSLELSGAKLFRGRDAISTDKFTFELYEGATATGTPLNTQEVQGVNSGTFTFDLITYALDLQAATPLNDLGDHTYTVVERVPATNPTDGITYDTTEYTFTVTVTDAGDGTLTVASADRAITGSKGVFQSEGFDFVNDYAASGRLAIRGSKLLSGRTGTFSDTFSFTLAALTTGAPLPTPATSSLTFTANGEQEFTFPMISYSMLDLKGTNSRNFVYTLAETGPGPAPKDGITYDGTTHLITVTVTDNRDGTLGVTVPTGYPWSVTYDTTLDSYLLTKPSYTNRYAASGTLSLSGIKVLRGRQLKADDEFTFELYEGATATGTPLQTKTLKGVNSGSFLFDPITYAMDLSAIPQRDDRGQHTYTVVEHTPAANPSNGIRYDHRSYTFTVTVTDAGDGTLTVTSADRLLTGGKGAFQAAAFAFVNDYAASGSLELSGTKLFRGRDATADDEFTFELYAGSAAGGTPLDTKTVKGVNSGTYTFDAIAYALDLQAATPLNDLGNHTYTVVERVPATNPSSGITYDTRKYTFTVTVTDAGDGTLTVASADRTITGSNGIFQSTGLDYVNDYAASGSLELSGAKLFRGRDATADDEFTFELYAGTEATGTPIDTKTVKGVNSGTFTFDVITYALDLQAATPLNDLGDHTYTVVERVPATNPSSGITYDAAKYTFTVTVTDAGDGTLTVASADRTITGSNGVFLSKGLDYVNDYAASGTLELSGAKLFRGRDATADDEFTFELYAGTEATGTPLDTKTVKGVNSGTFTFDLITYALDLQAVTPLNDLGDHTYTVVERVPATNPSSGITYDTAKYTFTVTVTDAGDGTLCIASLDRTIAGSNGVFQSTGLDYVNDYAASGTLELSGAKLFRGRDTTADDEFTFELYAGATATGTPIDTKTVKGVNSGTFTFDVITYALDIQAATPLNDLGDHTYTVVERVPATNPTDGITYDTTKYTFTVTVTDAGDGTLTVTSLDRTITGSDGVFQSTGLDYVNDYAASGTLELSGAKLFRGRDATADDEFTFELYAGTEATGTPIDTKTVKGVNSGTFTFDVITYALDLQAATPLNDLGDHTYTVVERVPATNPSSGITYDTRKYTFTVTVTDAGDGTLTVASLDRTITGSNGIFQSTGLDYVNDYAASGTLELSGAKLFRGRDATADDEFTFELYVGTEATGTPIDTKTVKGVNSGTFTFDAITYALDLQAATPLNDLGDHTYTVVERAPATNPSSGITYDTATYTFTVTVTDAGDGTLTVASLDRTITGSNGVFQSTGLDYVNDYAASGSLELSGTKLFRGRDATADDEFTFELYVGTEATGTPIDTKTVKGVNSGTFTFDLITYALDLQAATPLNDLGDHTYAVVERVPAKNPSSGITYDTAKYTFTVTVTDAGDGTLTVASLDRTITGSNGIFQSKGLDYVNDYAASGTLELSGAKLFRGRDATADDEFTFELYEGATATGTPIDTKTVKGVNSGTFTFDAIIYALDLQAATPFNDLGDHTYTVVERVPATNPSSGITYDTAKYTFTVTVTDADDGTLTVTSADRTITGSNGVFQSTGLDFVNDYAASGTLELSGKKTLNGRDLNAEDLFTFTVEEDGTQVATGANNGTGVITFTDIKYTLADLLRSPLTLTVTEDTPNPEVPGLTIDPNSYLVVVELVDNGDGTITATPTYPEGGLVFTNTYEAFASLTISGTKTLTGKPLGDETFGFAVVEGNPEVTISTGTQDTQGNIVFQTIQYSLADVGEHRFLVREQPGEYDGISCDTTCYTIDITVVDRGDGCLILESEDCDIQGADGVYTFDGMDFINAYHATGQLDVDLVIDPGKQLTGRALAADEFAFELVDAQGTVMQTVRNDAQGNIPLGILVFNELAIGEHVFTVREVVPETPEEYMTYDRMVLTFTVSVTDNGDGTLDVQLIDAPEDAVFNNSYVTPTPSPQPSPTPEPSYEPISVSFEVRKTLVNRTLKDNEFTFVLRDRPGNELQRVGNTADGTIPFSPRRFSRTGTFLYTIEEVAGTDENILYDKTLFSVRVVVWSMGDTLRHRVEYLKDGVPYGGDVAFVNTYEMPATGDGTPRMILLLALSSALLGGAWLGLQRRKRA